MAYWTSGLWCEIILVISNRTRTACSFDFEITRMICNGNRTEWSPIRSVIIRVITKSDDRAAGVRFVYHEYDYSMITSMIWIGRHEVLLSINHKNFNFREKKNSQVMKEWENLHLMSLWNRQQSKWICWLPSDERKTSLLSVKNAIMHENAQYCAELHGIWLNFRTLVRAVFPARFKVFKLSY